MRRRRRSPAARRSGDPSRGGAEAARDVLVEVRGYAVRKQDGHLRARGDARELFGEQRGEVDLDGGAGEQRAGDERYEHRRAP